MAKQTLFLQVLKHIEPLVQKGYSFSIEEIMSYIDDTLNFITYIQDARKKNVLDDL